MADIFVVSKPILFGCFRYAWKKKSEALPQVLDQISASIFLGLFWHNNQPSITRDLHTLYFSAWRCPVLVRQHDRLRAGWEGRTGDPQSRGIWKPGFSLRTSVVEFSSHFWFFIRLWIHSFKILNVWFVRVFFFIYHLLICLFVCFFVCIFGFYFKYFLLIYIYS